MCVLVIITLTARQPALYKPFCPIIPWLVMRENDRFLGTSGEGCPTRKLIAFGWYGGKYSHLDWLLPLLPRTHHFCEPYGGSAAVLINREPSPVETYNDLDGDVVNFFRVLRDKKDELIEKIGLTPFSFISVNKAEYSF
jgi:hypothetical protein